MQYKLNEKGKQRETTLMQTLYKTRDNI